MCPWTFAAAGPGLTPFSLSLSLSEFPLISTPQNTTKHPQDVGPPLSGRKETLAPASSELKLKDPPAKYKGPTPRDKCCTPVGSWGGHVQRQTVEWSWPGPGDGLQHRWSFSLGVDGGDGCPTRGDVHL